MLKQLKEIVNEFSTVTANLSSDHIIAYHTIASGLHKLTLIIREAENQGLSSSEILTVIEPLRLLCGQSPFLSRVQTWLRGYPGDFETIEYICDNSVKAVPNTLAFYLECHGLASLASQQHRNKVAWQSKCIIDTILLSPNAKILSIACGSSRDIRNIQDLVKTTNAHFFLNDADSDALHYSQTHLESISSQITVLSGNVFKSVAKFSNHQPFDAIIAGGLFDYLTNRQIEWLLAKLIPLLNINGSLYFTNIAQGNPDRIWMEYLVNWHIIERSKNDIYQLVKNLKNSENINVTIEKDTTGLTLLIKLQKN